jgi:hypothetical protein
MVQVNATFQRGKDEPVELGRDPVTRLSGPTSFYQAQL